MCAIKAIVLLALLALACQQTSAGFCAGCVENVDPESEDVKTTLAQVLQTQNSDDKITKVISVSKQVVAGVKYIVEFETDNINGNNKRLCKSEYVLQAWVSKVPQVLSYSCKQRSIDQLAVRLAECDGCPTKQDPKTFDVSEHLDKVLATQNSDDKVSRVISVTTQVVNGVKYTVVFEAKNPKTGDRRICKTEFISRPWISKVPEVVSYKCQKTLVKRSLAEVPCPGCETKEDPQKLNLVPQLQQVLATQNSDDKIIRVISITSQVVAGTKYNVKFQTKNPSTKVQHVCSVVYIHAPWISKVPQVLSYHCTDNFKSYLERNDELIKEDGMSKDIKRFVEEAAIMAVDRVNLMTNCIYLKKLVRIVQSKTKFIPYLAWEIEMDVEVASTNCTKNDNDDYSHTENCDFVTDHPNNMICHATLKRDFKENKTKINWVQCTTYQPKAMK